ncbi:metal ABC transporter solute-binding protein, Zn/Mn family [Castellaniella sp.]|uniref:metal ABC transporter solute-binding protein, Zn/Mn family n=1 Tax=Castellaniella sp. TaxID=1955812 RepID=UPI003C7825A0
MFELWRHLGAGLALCLALGTAQAQTQGAPGAQAPGAAPAARLRVVASFSILADMVREVGGDDIRLDVLVGPMRDAHTFEPSPKDARALGAAQVLVVNGLGFESWMPRLLEASGFKGQTILASRGVAPRHLSEAEAAQAGADEHDDDDHAAHDHGHGHAHEAGAVDPHAWQNLSNGVQYVQNIAQGLAQADPAHGSAYFARADAYVQQLREADARWREQLAAVPEDRRVLATSHDAFGYFGAAYGIRILSLVGISSEAEPSARAMADLLNQVRTQHVAAVFLEHGSGSQALRQLADEAGVTLGGALYADTLGKPGQEASTYLGMFRWNTQQLLAAWQGDKSAQ